MKLRTVPLMGVMAIAGLGLIGVGAHAVAATKMRDAFQQESYES
jgi:hypothetical protein